MSDPASFSNIILPLIAFGLTIIPAIIIHELGHFFAAKLVGISILEFGIGFPPRLRRLFVWRETEFTLNLIPLGGFVRPLGEDMIGPADDDKYKCDLETLEMLHDVDPHFLSDSEQLELRGYQGKPYKSLNQASPLARIWFMAAGALANFALALALFFVVALLGLPLKTGGLAQVVAMPPGSIFAGADAQPGDLIEAINGERFDDFPAFYDALAEYRGQSINFSMLRGATRDPFEITVEPRFGNRFAMAQVVLVIEDSPAAAAGIQEGDLISKINGVPLAASGRPAEELIRQTREHEGKAMSLTLLRQQDDGTLSPIQLVVIPRAEPPQGPARLGMGIRSQFGLGDATRFADAGDKIELIPQSAPAAIRHSLRTTALIIQTIAELPGRLLDGSLTGRDARPISIIGISKIGGELLQRSANEGAGVMLNFVAIISIFLAIGNLLPIPALDGGRILFVLLEIVRGKRINPELEAKIHLIGIALLLLLGIAVMVFDVIDPPTLG